jgi:pilus assembly protein CpaE
VSAGPVVAVVGAGGGCGATTLACGLALAWARAGRPVCLLELDLERGDLAGGLGLTPERSLADLTAVAGEIGPEHVRRAAHPHPSGLAVLFAPERPGAADGWSQPALTRLLEAVRADCACVVDAGAGPPPPAVAAAATAILVVAPALGPRAALVAAPPRCAPQHELSARALALAAGLDLRATLPAQEREAAELSAGRWPRGRRAPLARAVADLAEAIR